MSAISSTQTYSVLKTEDKSLIGAKIHNLFDKDTAKKIGLIAMKALAICALIAFVLYGLVVFGGDKIYSDLVKNSFVNPELFN